MVKNTTASFPKKAENQAREISVYLFKQTVRQPTIRNTSLKKYPQILSKARPKIGKNCQKLTNYLQKTTTKISYKYSPNLGIFEGYRAHCQRLIIGKYGHCPMKHSLHIR
ncbi:hypothetical protein [Microcoleus sp. PH2017_18_LLB_O_A]|jgi:hypothetical protein|uniref:hypothetical protein n=1 Tax=Microcoleus sp. PH2017_18_LLB_O_A TaxID=2798829 RepID=UPI001DA05E77|nr:hypothetical protein [Microcoleus sp. PH2017_18_LLB_O_A]MCC3515158.1 hypothetical protein [Microcoleus sp. PH2017_18_LLB_O_A]